jgi:hypothetical protein
MKTVRGGWTPANVVLGAGAAWLVVRVVLLLEPYLRPLPWFLWLLLLAAAWPLFKLLALLFFLAVEYAGKWPTGIAVWGLALWLTFR